MLGPQQADPGWAPEQIAGNSGPDNFATTVPLVEAVAGKPPGIG